MYILLNSQIVCIKKNLYMSINIVSDLGLSETRTVVSQQFSISKLLVKQILFQFLNCKDKWFL